jgi:hypothetical protein
MEVAQLPLELCDLRELVCGQDAVNLLRQGQLFGQYLRALTLKLLDIRLQGRRVNGTRAEQEIGQLLLRGPHLGMHGCACRAMGGHEVTYVRFLGLPCKFMSCSDHFHASWCSLGA